MLLLPKHVGHVSSQRVLGFAVIDIAFPDQPLCSL